MSRGWKVLSIGVDRGAQMVMCALRCQQGVGHTAAAWTPSLHVLTPLLLCVSLQVSFADFTQLKSTVESAVVDVNAASESINNMKEEELRQ